MATQDVVETMAIVLAVGLLAELLAGYLRLPRMVLLLGAGALLGPSVVDGVELPLDSVGVQLLLTLGISFILFHGGLQLSLSVLRPVAAGLALLAVPGVVVTAVVTGVAATAAFGLSLEEGLLLGAVLAPTDPAILIPLFERLRIRPKVVQTLVAEAALNDPTGAVLALALGAFVLDGGGSLTEPLGEFLVDVGISALLGLAFGLVLALTVSTNRFGRWRESPVLATLLIVSAGFFSIDSTGGSGYLGAFLAGVIVGNMDALGLGMSDGREDELRSFAALASEVTVIFVFVALGVNLPFPEMGAHAGPALATLAALVLLARPLTVVLSLLPNRRGRWEPAELAFVAWTRETGVVPAALAGLLVAEGVPLEEELLTTVAFAVVVTLLLQATTKGPFARRLGLAERS